MGVTARSWRVVAALLFSAALVVGAYELASGVASPPTALASSESAALQAIATKDSNGDGLPDWEKVLYGIPITSTTTDYFHLGMTDGQAVARGLIVPKAIANLPVATTTSSTVSPDSSLPAAPAPGTLTAAFADNFFTLYLAAKQANGGANLSQSQLQTIATEALNQLSSSVTAAPDFKSLQDLSLTATAGQNSLRSFANAAGAVFLANTANASTSEINYLKDAVQNNDTSALVHITEIAKAYRDTATGLAALPVPSTLAPYDLAIINALARLSGILTDFTKVNSDPLSAMLALQQYPSAVQALGNGFIGVNSVYVTANVTMAPTDPGAEFVNLIPEIAASQAASTTPTVP